MSITAVIAQEYSPYIYKVYDYCPAPGQFVNDAPIYEPGFTKEDMIREVENYIVGDERSLVSLGAWGGYIIFGFDHPVVNVEGENDFIIWGNAFLPSETGFEGGLKGGSSEPGIVMVSYDANGNGLPDDAWYELAGSKYHSEDTIHDYAITYYKPAGDTEDIRWEDNKGNTGYVYRNTFHTQAYWPEWLDDETLTYSGARLADNYSIVEQGGNRYYIQEPYDWGYADNKPYDHEDSEMNIEWAVDGEGNPVHLDKIHFVKVYTAVNQTCGSLGESSTEISGAKDLHPEAGPVSIPSINQEEPVIRLLSNPVKDYLILASSRRETVSICDLQGRVVASHALSIGTNRIDCSRLADGIYVLSANGYRGKVVKRAYLPY